MAQIVASPLSADEAVPMRVGGGLGAVRAARLAQDAADVVGCGVLADEQRGADLAVAHAPRDEAQDLDLPCGQLVAMALGRDRGNERAYATEQRRHADPLGQRGRLAEQLVG